MSDKDESFDLSFELDGSAEDLYKQLGGIDDAYRVEGIAAGKSSLIDLLNQQTKQLDQFRILLAEAAILFAEIIKSKDMPALAEEITGNIKLFIATLKKLAEFPEFDGKIVCRLRGQQFASGKSGSESYDYELSFNNILLDSRMALVVEERRKSKSKELYNKLLEAFQSYSSLNVFNFSIGTGGGTEEDYQKLDRALKLMVKFYNNPTREGFSVLDEYGQPSINLTMLAAMNRVKAEALQKLVNKIRPSILGPVPDKGLALFATVYDAIVASLHKRADLSEIPIEVNNAQLLMQNLQADPKRSSVVVQISRLVLAKYGSNPRMASEIINSVSSAGYANVRPETMGNRLTKASSFLELTEKSENQNELHSKALRNIEEGLDHLPDDMYDNISVSGSEASTIDSDGQETKFLLHDKILDFLSFFIRRSSIKKKVQDIANKNIWFDDEDYEVIAKDFLISKEDAVTLISLLRDCFDFNGNFRRSFFERNIDGFVKCGSKVFEFLWHYLKELPLRNDRVSFLNALQSLVAQIQQPKMALDILLSDIFVRSAAKVQYSDRNAFILATALLTSKRSSLGRTHVELTPEDVLQAKLELNPETVANVVEFFDQNHEHLLQKFRMITEQLMRASAKERFADNEMQPRFLLYLIREMVIFFSLVGGKSAHVIIRGVVNEFGEPSSAYYQEMKNKDNLRHSLQLLQISARSLRRFGDPNDMDFLVEIVSKEEAFEQLYDEPDPLNHVQRVMEKIRSAD